MKINAKTIKVFYLLAFLALIGIILIIVFGYISLNIKSHVLQEFIIGRWVGEYIDNENGILYHESYQVEFIQPNKLILNLKTKQFTKYNDLYYFKFTGEGQIEVRSRNVDEWELLQVNDSLYIRSRGNLVRYVPFRRVPTISWELIAFISMIIVVGIFMVTILPIKKGNFSLVKKVSNSNHSFIYSIFVYVLLGITFVIGWLSSIIFWESYPFRTIRLPWDAVISIEGGILFLLLGLKVLSINCKSQELSPIPAYILTFTSFFIFGWGAYGMIIGLLRLILILWFGQYPPA